MQKTKYWQITDERREALEQASHICHEVTAFDTAKVLRAMLEEVEFLMRSTDDTCLACATKLEVIDQQTARIQALEGTVAALREIAVEERARALWFVGSDPTKPPNLDWEISPNKISEKVKNLWRTPAHSQLQAEHPEVFQ